MKTRNSSSRPANHTPGQVRYCQYFLEFPDGDVWSDYFHIAGGFNAWIKNTAIWKKNPDRARTLAMKGECHWKDNNGVIHRMRITETPCDRKWGINRQIKRSALELKK